MSGCTLFMWYTFTLLFMMKMNTKWQFYVAFENITNKICWYIIMFSLKVISFLGMGLVFMKPGNYKATICASSPFMGKYKQMNSFFLRTNLLAYLLAARCHWAALCTNRPHPLTKFHSCVAKGPAIHTHTHSYLLSWEHLQIIIQGIQWV